MEYQREQQQQADAARQREQALQRLVQEAAANPAPEPSTPPSSTPSASSIPRPLAYRAPAQDTADAMPTYPDIVRGNRLLRGFATVLAALGWVALAIAAIGLLMFFVGVVQAYAYGPRVSGLTLFFGGVTYGLPCLVAAAMLRMYGALAMAVRDIARNSHKP